MTPSFPLRLAGRFPLLFTLFLTTLLSACGGGGGTVGLPTGTALFSNAPAGLTLVAGASTSFSAGGGTPTYSVSTSSADVATATISGSR